MDRWNCTRCCLGKVSMCLLWIIDLSETLLGLPSLNRYHDDFEHDDHIHHDHIFYHLYHHLHCHQQTVVEDGLAVLDWVKGELEDSADQVVRCNFGVIR